LDGTLADNSEGIRNGFIYALKQLGLPESRLPDDFIGPPLRDSFRNFYGMDDAQTEEAVRLYREYYKPTGIYECFAYPGVPEMLEELKKAGAGIYLATSKPRVFAEVVLNHTDLMKYFDAVVGAELDGRLGEKPEVIRHILDHLIPPGGLPVLMVGDRWHDAKGAQDCFVDFAAALWGFGQREEFAPYACVRGLFENVAELSRWLVGEAEA
jgi:phosphoglycolate phosphatase